MEQLKTTEIYNTYTDGGLNLVDVKTRCIAHFIAPLIKQFLRTKESNVSDALQYFIGTRLTFIPKLKPGPHQDSINPIFNKAIMWLKDLKIISPSLDWNNVSTKSVYDVLISKIKTRLKVKIRNPLIYFKNSFKNVTNPFLSPTAKEHTLFPLHNILPTADRRQRCRRQKNNSCYFCHRRETVPHIFGCKKSTPALKWFLRRLTLIDNECSNLKINEIMLLNFMLNEKKKQNTPIWLTVNFSLALWKARLKQNKTTITKEVTTNLKRKIRLLKHNQMYKENLQFF